MINGRKTVSGCDAAEKHLSHRPDIVRSLATALLKKMPAVRRLIRPLINRLRAKREYRILELANLYPDDRAAIVADYLYSIKVTHRGILQVVNLETVVRDIESRGIDGAFVETGTYTGGASAYALRALLRLSKSPLRDYWGFDSFEGMPTPTVEDGDHGSLWVFNKPMDKSPVRERSEILTGHDVNRADYDRCLSYLRGTGYPLERLHLIKGWFQNTLPKFKSSIGPIAILRLDGDLYESTKVVFETLYDQVVPGGIIVIDDYGAFQGCRGATDEFLARRPTSVHLVYVDNSIRYFVKP